MLWARTTRPPCTASSRARGWPRADVAPTGPGRSRRGAGAPRSSRRRTADRRPRVDAVIIAAHDSTHSRADPRLPASRQALLCESRSRRPSPSARLRPRAGDRQLVDVGFMRRSTPATPSCARPSPPAARAPLVAPRGLPYGQLRTRTTSGRWAPLRHPRPRHLPGCSTPRHRGRWHAPASTSLPRASRPAADHAADRQRCALHRRGLPQRPLRLRMRCEVVCETGALALTEPPRSPATPADPLLPYSPDWRPRFADAYRLELARVGRLHRGRYAEPAGDRRRRLRASAVADAVHTSMRQGGGTSRSPGPDEGAACCCPRPAPPRRSRPARGRPRRSRGRPSRTGLELVGGAHPFADPRAPASAARPGVRTAGAQVPV